ncbi:hypothetical protein O6H91_01G174100 [Diphasiastrum complanatum]|uniref:Uncharacterized protein n=1 Tax=Diphasiastrum complanatum TaxID=34168 RepID=A0ACC2EYY5_DIPCM|nr:hypothetical protein O6H91_01G174100 [Diphasiastrum complanatum]
MALYIPYIADICVGGNSNIWFPLYSFGISLIVVDKVALLRKRTKSFLRNTFQDSKYIAAMVRGRKKSGNKVVFRKNMKAAEAETMEKTLAEEVNSLLFMLCKIKFNHNFCFFLVANLLFFCKQRLQTSYLHKAFQQMIWSQRQANTLRKMSLQYMMVAKTKPRVVGKLGMRLAHSPYHFILTCFPLHSHALGWCEIPLLP